MRNLFLLILLFCFSLVIAQKVKSKQPTKSETEAWIVDKLTSNGYSEGNTSNEYSISFEGATIKVENFLRSEFGNIKSFSIFSIKDIEQIYFTENYNILVLNIKLKKGTFVNQTFNGEIQKPRSDFMFELNNSFKQNNLPDRMKKAFSRLIVLNGGKSIIVKEVF